MYKQLNCSKEPLYNIMIMNIKYKYETCGSTCIYTKVPKKSLNSYWFCTDYKVHIIFVLLLAPSYCINN